MNRARSFFFVCLGIRALVLAYHFGARSAGAQGSNALVPGYMYSTSEYAASSDGRVYWRSTGYGANSSPWNLMRTVAVPSPVVALNQRPQAGDPIWVLYCQDGTVLEWQGNNGAVVSSNVFDSGTPAQSISIGQLKAKYATPVPAVKP